jgi:Domain of unknown function (DUF3330)
MECKLGTVVYSDVIKHKSMKVKQMENVNVSGGKVQNCASDEVCEVQSCHVCLTEIPADLAKVVQVHDYVYHFCGPECLEAWQKQSEQANQEKG